MRYLFVFSFILLYVDCSEAGAGFSKIPNDGEWKTHFTSLSHARPESEQVDEARCETAKTGAPCNKIIAEDKFKHDIALQDKFLKCQDHLEQLMGQLIKIGAMSYKDCDRGHPVTIKDVQYEYSECTIDCNGESYGFYTLNTNLKAAP